MAEPGLHIGMLTRAVVAHGVGGGMELHAETLRRGLVAAGHRVTMITTSLASGESIVADQWGETHFVGGGPPITYTRGWWRASLQRLLAIHRADPLDVIGGHGKAAYAYLGARGALAEADRAPVVVITHQSIITELSALMTQFSRRPLNVARRLPKDMLLYMDDLRRLRLAERITATNDLNGRAFLRWFPLLPDQVEVIHNSVNVADFAATDARRVTARRRLGVASDERVLLTLARLERGKGQQYLIAALTDPALRPYLPYLKVFLAGEGRARAALETQVRRAGLERVVTFLGLSPHSETPALWSAADIAVHPALSEGTSLAMLEAMASGRPLIASAIDANREFVEDGKTGVLVAPARPAALAHAIAGLLADPKRAQRLGDEARAFVAARYDERAMVAHFEQAFRQTASAWSARRDREHGAQFAANRVGRAAGRE